MMQAHLALAVQLAVLPPVGPRSIYMYRRGGWTSAPALWGRCPSELQPTELAHSVWDQRDRRSRVWAAL